MSKRDRKLGEILRFAPEKQGRHLIQALREAANHLERSLQEDASLTAVRIRVESIEGIDLPAGVDKNVDHVRVKVLCEQEFDDVAEVLSAVALAGHEALRSDH